MMIMAVQMFGSVVIVGPTGGCRSDDPYTSAEPAHTLIAKLMAKALRFHFRLHTIASHADSVFSGQR